MHFVEENEEWDSGVGLEGIRGMVYARRMKVEKDNVSNE